MAWSCALTAALAVVASGACAAPWQDALAPAGPQAAHIARLWNLMLAVCTLVYVAVGIGVLLSLRNRLGRADATTPPDVALLTTREQGPARVVTAAVAVSIVLLLALFVASVVTQRALASMPLTEALNIEVTGNQFWWEVRYQDPQPSRIFTTANEMHIPVGRPVQIQLRSTDVIHSLWIPNLHGKKDLIPGQTALLQLRADAPGVYRAQCAEFCGYQHAHMALHVVAESAEQYAQWADAQRQPAAEPAQADERRGRDVFLAGTCVMCHTVQGTPAQGRYGPDLTHLASRPTLAAGTLPNTRGHLAAWIVDPQSIKPGTNMPANVLPPEDLQALLAYLTSLR
jgi:cytochrome c oxidase subunit II